MSSRSVVTTLGLLLGLSVMLVPESARGQACPLIVEGTRWLYHASPPPADWEWPDTLDDPDASTWQLGCAPFGSPGCGFNSRTAWPVNATLYLRQHVFLTGAEFNFTARVAIDNDFELFVNGVSVASLAKEGCANRWDAVVPIPDGLWVPGDNVIAVRVVDRGGIATFEMRLDAEGSSQPCPPGCATLVCDAPGPDVTASPPATACPDSEVLISAMASWSSPCPSGFTFAFDEGGGRSTWGGPDWLTRVGPSAFPVLVTARCGQAHTCPVGAATETVVSPEPGPPPALGAVIRVSRDGRSAELDWRRAPPLEVGATWELARDKRPAQYLPFIVAGGLLVPAWTDPDATKLLYYRVHGRDSCGRRYR